MDGHTECLAYGAIISFIVSALKNISIVKAHPKITAALLSAVSVALIAYFGSGDATVAVFARCLAETFAVSVATHEAVVQPVKDKINDA